MHQAAYAQLGQPWSYATREVQPEQLGQVLDELAGPDLLGINLTLPLKQEAFRWTQRVSAEAHQVGAINCLRWNGGCWEGHNSDAQGWLDSFQEEIGLPLAGRKAVLIGAGGACRAILCVLRQQRAGPLIVLNRTAERARSLLQAGEEYADMEHFSQCLEGHCLVVQTTSVGMWPESERLPVPWPEIIPSGVLACDLIYNPRPTAWLAQARQRGAHTMDGCGMLVHQAARAIEWWSGLRPDPGPMRQALLASL